MSGFVDLYTPSDTFLHRLDPRVKVLAVVSISLLAIILTELLYLTLLGVSLVILIILGRASYRKTMFAMKYVFRVMIIIMLLWPFFDPHGEPVLFEFGPIKITVPGIVNGIETAMRVFCLAVVWYILMFTTSQRDLVRALVKMGLRFDFGLSLAMSLRFLPTLTSTVESIKDAQRARGMELDRGSLKKRAENYVSVLVPTIVTALKTSDTLSLALQSRGYGARADRTYLRELQMRATDYAALCIFVAAFVVPFTAKYILSVPL